MKKIFTLVILSGLFILGACGDSVSEGTTDKETLEPEAKAEDKPDREVNEATAEIQAKGETEPGVGGVEYTLFEIGQVVFENDDYQVFLEKVEFQNHYAMEQNSYNLHLTVDNNSDKGIHALVVDVAVDGEELQVSSDTEKGTLAEAGEENSELFVQARIAGYDNPPVLNNELTFTLLFKADLEDEVGEITEDIVIEF